MVHIQLVPSLLPFNYVRHHCFTSSVLCFWLFLELFVSCIFHSFCACLFFVCTLFLLQRFVSSSSLLCGFFVRSSLSVQFVSEKIGKGEFLQIWIYWNFDRSQLVRYEHRHNSESGLKIAERVLQGWRTHVSWPLSHVLAPRRFFARLTSPRTCPDLRHPLPRWGDLGGGKMGAWALLVGARVQCTQVSSRPGRHPTPLRAKQSSLSGRHT